MRVCVMVSVILKKTRRFLAQHRYVFAFFAAQEA
jgi:hypothetical protein